MEWGEPILLRCDFEVGQKRSPAFVCLGFPRYAEERFWTCAFQFQGVGGTWNGQKDGHVYRVTGYHGLGALMEASNTIRSRLDGLAGIRSRGTPYEFVFPRFLPASWWYGIYKWAAEMVASEIAKQPARQKMASSADQSARTTWDQPTLLDQRFKFTSGRTIAIRLGIPTFMQRRGDWSCAFQLRGVEGSSIKEAFGKNGLLAVARASDSIRVSLDQIGQTLPGKDGYELTFPAHLPTEYGLGFHRRLSRRIDAELKKRERRDTEVWEARAAKFKDILVNLPPAARL